MQSRGVCNDELSLIVMILIYVNININVYTEQ